VEILTGHPVTRVAAGGNGVVVTSGGRERTFDAAFLTVANPVVAQIVPDLPSELRERLLGTAYLGVACTVVAGASPLSRNYVLNLAEGGFSLTGVIEMTNLVSAAEETKGHALVYLPRYALSDDPLFARSDAEIREEALSDLARIYPHVKDGWVRHVEVHRARRVQPVPLAGAPPVSPPFELPVPGVFVVNSAQLPTSVLNNNACVGLAREAAGRAARLRRPAREAVRP
jgi:protoporphyrinogen oxidase